MSDYRTKVLQFQIKTLLKRALSTRAKSPSSSTPSTYLALHTPSGCVGGKRRADPIQWDVVSGDPDPRVTAQQMIKAVITQARNGSIIVMHMNGRGWHTAEALPNIIMALQARGFQFVTVSQLLGK